MPNYHILFDEPPATPSGTGTIRPGLPVLTAIPVMRVAFTVISFIIRKNKIYAGITLLVLPVMFFQPCSRRAVNWAHIR